MRKLAILTTSATLALGLSNCGSRSSGASATSATPAPKSALAKVCPRTIKIQTDWYPEPEYGGLYELAGPHAVVDAQHGRYSGEIGNTGVTLQVRAGGPYIGNQDVSSLLYQDPSLFGGFVDTDEAVKLSGKLPTIAVFSLLDKSPSVLMWNPAKYHFTSFPDIGRSNPTVLYFEGTAFIDYLVGKGYLHKSQLDPSYDGSPARFVTSGGTIVQEAFATSEPYKYEHDLPQWDKSVAFKLVSDSGYRPYSTNIAVQSSTLQSKRACLKLLVPLLQQADAQFARDSAPTNAAILREVKELESSWTLTPGGVHDSVAKMLSLKILANDPAGTIGGFDMARVNSMIDILRPIYARQGVTSVKPGLKPADIATNAFIDPRIHL